MCTNRFGRLRATLGLERVRLHDLRHFVASVLGDGGMPIATISSGGDAGFLTTDRATLHWTECPGNNWYNSLGNLALDRRLALLAIDFTNGTTTEISGTTHVAHEPKPVVVLIPQLAEQVTHAIPGGWQSPVTSTAARRRP